MSDQEDDIQIIDFSQETKKKKKASKKKDTKESKISKAATAGDQERAKAEASKKVSLLVSEGHVTYQYDYLLERISTQLRDKNPQLAEGSKLKRDEDPHVVKLGTTKTSWQNFDSMVTALDRKHDHMMSYIAAELGTEATLGAENNMILIGKFQGKHIERLYKKYLEHYVKCSNCKGYQTKLEKDASTRLYMLECKACGASKSVTAIKAGFHAVKRGERKKEKARMA